MKKGIQTPTQHSLDACHPGTRRFLSEQTDEGSHHISVPTFRPLLNYLEYIENSEFLITKDK